ncbi:MAG TPA: PAS domain S-box protein [Ferruginibacter sp.]|nr:PAS domain S-box protein [Ferruginibacter sp.]
MSFFKDLTHSGTLHADNPSDRRNILIVNYFSLILFVAVSTLVILRSILFFCMANKRILISTNTNMVFGALVTLLPLAFNRAGYTRLAKYYLCWLPSIIIVSLYTLDAMKRTTVFTSEYDSLYFFLLGVSAMPYLLLSLSNKKELIAGLLLPLLIVVFSDHILSWFGVSHSQKGMPGDEFDINRIRAFVSYFIVSSCCFVMKILVEREVNKNTLLIAQLEEKNKLIDKQAEKEIKESENRYRYLFEQAADAIIVSNKDNYIESANPSAVEMFGYSIEEFLKLRLEDIVEVNNLKASPVDLEIYKNQQIRYRERLLIKKDGSPFQVEINAKMLPDGSLQSFIRDVTVRKKAEEELIEAEAKFRDLVEKSSVGVYIIQHGKYMYVNPKFAAIFGYDQYEVINKLPVEALAHPDYMELIRDNMRKRIEGVKETTPYEIDGVKKSGEVIRLEIFGTRTQYKGEPAIIGTLSDVTEKKLLQEQVLDQKVQEQKKITRAVLKAEERERNRIGQELHDNVNQILAGTKLYLGLASKDEFAGRGLIKSSLELVDNAIEEMRSLSKEQVTPIKGIDLENLIHSLIDRLSTGSSLKSTVVYNLSNHELEDDLKLNIYRIIQEQMNNILKHSNAHHTNISLTDDTQALHVSIEDDGVGFDLQQKRKGIGLSNMINRIESYNGELKIYSSPGNGCEVRITIPYLNNN